EVEIWFGFENGMIYLLSGGGLGKDWTRNIQKSPAVRFRVGDVRVAGPARVVDDPILEARIRRVVGGKYYDFDPDGGAPVPDEWSRTASPVVIEIV
ncbi:MAG: hypothetical protein H0U31_04980, partial [Chloroflexia bacterium]|nr:hypothetical protein [Chloroflexia bacterium]